MTETFQLHEQQALAAPGVTGWWQRISLWLSGFREAKIIARIVNPDAASRTNQFFYFLEIPSIIPFRSPSFEWDILRDGNSYIVKTPNTDLARKLDELEKEMPNGSWVVLE